MKKGNVVRVVPSDIYTYSWIANGIGYASIHYYENFKDKIGIFLRVLDENFSLVLFGDEQIACLSNTLVKVRKP